ncbi:chemotaxis protein CheW [Marinobacterium aestuariivivens]|uniref:Chemotaxis protein CheW n=1 Tax=Marinobacterium aestuariivivens TaxID=1698799 RepID=A0ABW1ZXC6_9GAMM
MTTLQPNSAIEASEQAGLSRQFLTFLLADEEYAVDILRVQEIRGWMPVTRLPNTPDYLKGVLNLRGAIIPVIDLRQRFALEPWTTARPPWWWCSGSAAAGRTG